MGLDLLLVGIRNDTKFLYLAVSVSHLQRPVSICEKKRESRAGKSMRWRDALFSGWEAQGGSQLQAPPRDLRDLETFRRVRPMLMGTES